MSVIRLLPSTLVNRIAAGEVIERPASAVKELVENSIDAKSTNIEVTILGGGKDYICIQDDGIGMTPQEMNLAIQRHATSKLPDDDLFNIKTMGFRGEALPSIASVSRFKISSRKQNSEESFSLAINAGSVDEAKPTSLSAGTKIEVSDLFYATPARLKFLKSDRSEQMACEQVIERLALANPYISFSFYADGKKVLSINGKQGDLINSRLKRIANVMGEPFAINSVPFSLTRDGISITGFAGLPTFNKANSSNQYLFVNNRPVRDRLMLGVIKAAYQDFLARDRHPVVVLYIDMPLAEVDINVHPAKTEVRFRSQDVIRGMIISAIKNALENAGFRSSNTVSNMALSALTANLSDRSKPLEYASNTGSHHLGFGDSFSARPQYAMYSDINKPSVNVTDTPINIANNVDYGYGAAEENNLLLYPLGAARSQLHETYIVSQTKDGIIIVDQHAAHERIVYEKMKAELAASGIKRQPLLIPEVVELKKDEAINILEKSTELQALGLIIEPFGGHAVVVHEVPAILSDSDIQGLVKTLAEEINEYGKTLSLEDKLSHFAATAACHGSIRAGRRLNISEMDNLLRQIETTPHSGQCNHGRPTYIELKLSDIEKLFGRK